MFPIPIFGCTSEFLLPTGHQATLSNAGWRVTFPNGWTVSVQYGAFHYRRVLSGKVVAAEVAVLCDSRWYDTRRLEYTEPFAAVEGYCTEERVKEILTLTRTLYDFSW